MTMKRLENGNYFYKRHLTNPTKTIIHQNKD